jgi:hypothetical protein
LSNKVSVKRPSFSKNRHGSELLVPDLIETMTALLNSLALSPDGKTLAIGNVDGKIPLITLN